MRTVLLTSNNLRHFYIASCLAKFSFLEAVFAEKKASAPRECYLEEDLKLLSHWLRERSETEEAYFYNEFKFFKSSLLGIIHEIKPNEINNPKIFEQIKKINPDAVIVFGSSIIRDPLLSLIKSRAFNIHLGISPQYRGSATNFWAIYNNDFHNIGVTIHFIDQGIDSGDIIHQGRVNIDMIDTPHTLGCKAIIKGGELIMKILQELKENKLVAQIQNRAEGKLYRRMDLKAEHILEVKRSFYGNLVNFLNKHRDMNK